MLLCVKVMVLVTGNKKCSGVIKFFIKNPYADGNAS